MTNTMKGINLSIASKLPDTGVAPGSYLLEEVIKPLGLSIMNLAKDIKVPPNRLYQIINGSRELTPDTALRLGHYFGTGPEMWLYLQMKHDLIRAEEKWVDHVPVQRVRDGEGTALGRRVWSPQQPRQQCQHHQHQSPCWAARSQHFGRPKAGVAAAVWYHA